MQSEKKGCKKKAAKKDWIERVAVIWTVNRVLRDEEINRITDDLVALQDREDIALPAMRRQLEETEKAIDNMLNAIQQGVLTSSTKTRLEELEHQKSELEINVLQMELQRPRYTKELVVDWISQFKYGDVNNRDY